MQASIEADIATLKMNEKKLRQEIILKQQNLNTLKQKILNLSKNAETLTISEHAIIRYVERVLGIYLDEISKRILPDEQAHLIETLGDGHFPVNNGEFKIVVKNGIVVTLYTDDNTID